MKVLVLSHMYPNPVNQHAGIFVHNQCKALIQAGIEVRVVTPIPSFPLYHKWKDYKQLPKETELEGVPVHYIPTLMFPGGFFFSMYGYFYERSIFSTLKHIYQVFPFDLIHCHTIFPDGNAGNRLKAHFQVPVISTIHGSDIMLYPKRSRGVYRETLCSLKESEQVITVSRRLEQEALTLYPQVKVQTIYNGFDPVRFQPTDQGEARKKLGLPLDQQICLFVGNLYPVKGIPFLLKAFSQLIARTTDVHLYFVGGGSLKKSLQAQAKDLGIDSQISWMGRKPYEEIPTWIQSADVMVLSSLSEGLPSILLESMACGKPMIATDVGGIAEVLQDGETGCLVPAQDAEKLATALTDLFVENPHKIQQLGEKAYQVSQNYTWQQNARRIIDCYQQLQQNTARK